MVFVLYVSFLIGHLALDQEVSEISAFDEPLKELLEDFFDFVLPLSIRYQQPRNVTGSRNLLYFGKVVALNLLILTSKFGTECFHM